MISKVGVTKGQQGGRRQIRVQLRENTLILLIKRLPNFICHSFWISSVSLHANTQTHAEDLPLLERSVLAEMPFVPIGWWTPVPSTTPASPGCFKSSVRVLEEEAKYTHLHILSNCAAYKLKSRQQKLKKLSYKLDCRHQKCLNKVRKRTEGVCLRESVDRLRKMIKDLKKRRRCKHQCGLTVKIHYWKHPTSFHQDYLNKPKQKTHRIKFQNSGNEDKKDGFLDALQLGASIIYKI